MFHLGKRKTTPVPLLLFFLPYPVYSVATCARQRMIAIKSALDELTSTCLLDYKMATSIWKEKKCYVTSSTKEKFGISRILLYFLGHVTPNPATEIVMGITW